MADVFLEVIMDVGDLLSAGFEARDEIEDSLGEALEGAGLGQVTGGGGGGGNSVIDVEIADESKLAQALSVIRETLKRLEVPESTTIKRSTPAETIYRVYD